MYVFVYTYIYVERDFISGTTSMALKLDLWDIRLAFCDRRAAWCQASQILRLTCEMRASRLIKTRPAILTVLGRPKIWELPEMKGPDIDPNQ